MVFEFDTKEEFEEGVFKSVKEAGETNICLLISSSINDKSKKKLRKLI